MAERILEAKKEGDSLGGVIACSIGGVPRGLGEPIFDKLEADLAKAMLSIPASRGFEVGSGFGGTKKTGSQENDSFVSLPKGDIGTRTNRSGGIQGGISNGEEIYFRVAFKPTSSLSKPQETVSLAGAPMSLLPIGGRHDPCVLPRAVPIVEAMAALVVCDHFFRQKAISGDTSVNETI
jgi:chorismate synthase